MSEQATAYLHHRTGKLSLSEPVIMGIVNVTPDSFSDGGHYLTSQAAVEHAHHMIAQGAGVIDIGGESTRPGAASVTEGEELDRVLPVIEALCNCGVPLSIDTRKAVVARAALAAGASIVNDVEGLRDPAMRTVVAETRAAAIIMHMRGTPETMQQQPRYADVVREVGNYMRAAVAAAEHAGIARKALAIDPGIGFGKSVAHNLALVRNLASLTQLGFPIVVGLSRKSVLGKIVVATPSEKISFRDPLERLPACLALTLAAARHGARIVRTHDVRPTLDAIRAQAALYADCDAPTPPATSHDL